ncbi:oligosaccharide flippase family protein [Peribacillus sp. NPDC096622]|uniref:oligosaccharide flippase family protein n=1 Tax=Peribacillus sp. NPDC096622 TaxID=3364396 RepID=UPI00381A405A
MLFLRKKFPQIKKSKIAENTGWMLLGYLSKIGLQAITFIFLAKELGVEEFGMFSSYLAVVGIIAPFVYLGAYNLVIEDISKKNPVSRAIGNNLVSSLFVLPLGVFLVIIISFYLKTPIIISIFISIGVFLGGVLISINKAVNISLGTLKYNTYLEVLLGVLQLFSIFLLTIFNGAVIEWSIYYMACYLLTGIIALATLIKKYGRISFNFSGVRNIFKVGIHFAFAGFATNGLSDIDKTMITKFSSVESTGIYSVAQRITSMAFLPMLAFLGAVYPKFVNFEEGGYLKSRRIAFKILPLILAYSLIIVIAIWISAPFIVGLMGKEFEEAVKAVRILSFLLVIQGLQYPFADALTGSGKQKVRTYGQVFILVLSIIINMFLIPEFGWVGAAWTSLICQLIFLIILYVVPIFLKKKNYFGF